MGSELIALRQQIEIKIGASDDGSMVLSQASVLGDNTDQISFDARYALRLAAAILEACGYHNIVFSRHLGGLAFADVHLDEPPDAENAHLADHLAERQRDRERIQRELEKPEPRRRRSDTSAAERQRRHRARNRRDVTRDEGVTERDTPTGNAVTAPSLQPLLFDAGKGEAQRAF